MPRPIWKGNISFGLVMIPVALYSAEAKAAELDLDLVDSRDGERVRYQRVNERTGKEVPWKSIAKAHLVDDEYVILSDEDFKRAAADVVRGIEIVEFVPSDSVSPLYYQKPYYVGPGKGGEKVYALLRDVLKKTGQVGIAKTVIRSREHLAALTAQDDLLVLLILRFDEELRKPDELDIPRPAKAKASAQELSMAEQLVKGMSGEWKPEKFHDEYRAALKRFIEEKAAAGGKPVKRRAAAEEDEAPASYNIMDLLRKSVEQQQPSSSRAGGKKKTRTTRARRKAG